MTTPRRMIVVDDDPKVRLLLERAFRAQEFEIHAFATGGEALARIAQLRPDCVVSEVQLPDMEGERLLRGLRAVPGLEAVPFIALSALRSEARVRAVVGAGADAFLLKPFPLRELTEKVEALVARPPTSGAASGTLDADQQPTQPLQAVAHTTSIASPRRLKSQRTAPPLPAALAPPANETPSPAAEPSATAGAAEPGLPVVRMGGPVRVVVSPRPAGESAVPTRPMAPARFVTGAHAPVEGAPRRIELAPQGAGLGFGRFTRVEVRGRSFVVLTEAAAQPQFTVTTVITEKGVPLRKIDSALPHPLAREDDTATVRRQLDQQHDEVLRRLDDLVLDGARRRVVWSDQSRNVDGGLLAWTLSAVAQAIEAEIGTTETARQLRLTHERALAADEALHAFQITPAARVVLETGRSAVLPRRAVRTVAAWCQDFATAALGMDVDRVAEPVRQATRRHADDLERVGFYDRLRRRSRT